MISRWLHSNYVPGAILPPFHSSFRVTTWLSSQVRAHCSVISPWVAGHIKVGPPTGEREHFISHWHVHLYPHRPAGGCWACQPWGETGKKKKKGTQASTTVKTTWRNRTCERSTKLLTKFFWSVHKVSSCCEFWHPHFTSGSTSLTLRNGTWRDA